MERHTINGHFCGLALNFFAGRKHTARICFDDWHINLLPPVFKRSLDWAKMEEQLKIMLFHNEW